MSAGELALVVAVVLCALAFAALGLTLLRLRDTVSELRGELVAVRATTNELTAAVHEARADLDRFDEYFGAAAAISDTIGRGAKSTSKLAYSAPAIKAAGLVAGTGRAARKLRSGS